MSRVTQEQWDAVDRYVEGLLVGSDAALDGALDASAAAGLPPHHVSPSQGKLLELLARLQGARAILELGTLGGYSTMGPALETLAQLTGPFDLVFLDADKAENAEYLEWSLRLSRPGALIVADNVVRGGAIVDPSSNDPRVRGLRRFYELLAAEPRVSATAIQTVGSKGYDGFALAVVLS
jgi:predicted O-methyltransferase YrrM